MSERTSHTADSALQTLRQFMAVHRYPPSVREYAAAMGLRSSSTAARWLDLLEEAGYIERHEGRARTIVITEASAK
jgi:repressor LexA